MAWWIGSGVQPMRNEQPKYRSELGEGGGSGEARSRQWNERREERKRMGERPVTPSSAVLCPLIF